MRRIPVLTAAAAAVGLLAGCQGSHQSADDGSSKTSSSSPTPTPTPSDVTAERAPVTTPSNHQPSPTRVTESVPALTKDPTSGKKIATDSKGRIHKRPGQTGALTATDGKTTELSMTILSTTTRSSCTMRGFGNKLSPEHGKFVDVNARAVLAESAGKASIDLSASSFGPLGARDKPLAKHAWSEAAEGCTVSSGLDMLMTGGHSSTGHVMLDVPQGTTAIAFDPGGTPGWVWPLN
jgi:hypothetical protein